MQTFEVFVILICILAVGWLILYSGAVLIQMLLKKEFSVAPVFRDFGQKMWMTLGIGVLFFGLYVLLVLLGSYFLNTDKKMGFFVQLYEHPVDFIYFGLFIFACSTLFIYLVRMVIKYLYIKRRK